MNHKPMLASPADLRSLRFPIYGSPKLDGIRALPDGQTVYSRSLKPIPNKFIQQTLRSAHMAGLDGELIVGSPTAPDVINKSTSGCMRVEGEPDFTFFVFDHYLWGGTFESRYQRLQMASLENRLPPFGRYARVQLVQQRLLGTLEEVLAYESECVDQGFEGIILRAPDGPYKNGRSTTNEGYLLKVKRFVDGEAVVMHTIEEMHNTNAAVTNELGRTKRSSAKAGKVGKGTMGALHVRDLVHGWEFDIGGGFTAAQRAEEWKQGDIVKYKYFPVGMKNVPRHPIFLARRDARDMS